MSYKFSTGTQTISDLSGSDDANGNTGIDFEEDYVSLRTNGNDVLVVSGSNVGIGTATPDYTLDVAGNIGVNQYIYHNGDADTSINFTDDRIRMKAGGMGFVGMHKKESSPHQVTVNNGNNNIDFVVNSNNNSNDPVLRCDASAASVGIRTASPIAELDVAGKIAITSEVATPTAPADGKGWLYTKSDGKIYWQSNDVSETDLTAGGGGSGISFDGSTADGILTYKDSDEATVESNFTFDAVSQTAMISGSLHLRGEERIIPTEFQTSAKRERSFTLRKHIQISTTTTNSWIDIISWQPKVVGGTSNPGSNEFWAAVSFEINLTGHYNGVGNSHRRMEGVVFYMGSSASSADGYNNDTSRDATAVPNFRVNLSGWATTLQYNLDNGSAQGFQGMAYIVIHFTRGAGNEGDNIYWDIR